MKKTIYFALTLTYIAFLFFFVFSVLISDFFVFLGLLLRPRTSFDDMTPISFVIILSFLYVLSIRRLEFRPVKHNIQDVISLKINRR